MHYPNPFIIQRADPYIFKGPDGYYYFTASYPAFYDVNHGYDRIVLRRSKTVIGLTEAEEHTIWQAHSEGNMSKHIWAPEIHFIGDKWYIMFAAGDKDSVWNIRPYMLMCAGSNPIEDSWQELGRVQASDSDDSSFTAFSLDMTYFEHEGRHYLIWAEKTDKSRLYMAAINADRPWKLASKPILLSEPEYDWEMVKEKVNEGPSVLKTDDKIVVAFSASGTGAEYCIGLLWADKNSDLMNTNSWHKLSEPVLSTKDLIDEVGPGHNSFTVDENGSLLLVYHARPASHLTGDCGTYSESSLYDPCRHARIRLIKSFKNGLPCL
ncbi:MAG: family 43 glycosylhydrolase [Clostridium sp.]|nr:family 43 glycosylhydrolase [Clostridium sp.]